MSDNKTPTEVSGVLILNKPQGITSHDAVYKIRRAYGTKRVGHTGTLDPLACGVLVMLIGGAAKAAEYLVSDSKAYVATMRLGLTTDTEDITGSVITQSDSIPDERCVREAVSRFVGEIDQIPPMYSALKVDGKKLCDLAREGKTVERAARRIVIHSIDVSATDDPREYILSVSCSSGTYIRTLCADIGAALGCGAVMSALERTCAGGFDISESVTLEELDAMDMATRTERLIPTEKLFSELPTVTFPEFYHNLCVNGCEIYQKKIRTDFELGQRVRIYTPSGDFFALGEVREYENGTAIKAIKRFV